MLPSRVHSDSLLGKYRLWRSSICPVGSLREDGGGGVFRAHVSPRSRGRVQRPSAGSLVGGSCPHSTGRRCALAPHRYGGEPTAREGAGWPFPLVGGVRPGTEVEGQRIGIGGFRTRRVMDVAPGRLARARAAKKRAAERGNGSSMEHPMEVVPQGKKEQTKYGPGSAGRGRRPWKEAGGSAGAKAADRRTRAAAPSVLVRAPPHGARWSRRAHAGTGARRPRAKVPVGPDRLSAGVARTGAPHGSAATCAKSASGAVCRRCLGWGLEGGERPAGGGKGG